MSGSQGLFTSLQAGSKGDLGMICISARGSKGTYQENSPPRSLKESAESVKNSILIKILFVQMSLSNTCFFDMSMKNFRIQLEKCSSQSSFLDYAEKVLRQNAI